MFMVLKVNKIISASQDCFSLTIIMLWFVKKLKKKKHRIMVKFLNYGLTIKSCLWFLNWRKSPVQVMIACHWQYVIIVFANLERKKIVLRTQNILNVLFWYKLNCNNYINEKKYLPTIKHKLRIEIGEICKLLAHN